MRLCAQRSSRSAAFCPPLDGRQGVQLDASARALRASRGAKTAAPADIHTSAAMSNAPTGEVRRERSSRRQRRRRSVTPAVLAARSPATRPALNRRAPALMRPLPRHLRNARTRRQPQAQQQQRNGPAWQWCISARPASAAAWASLSRCPRRRSARRCASWTTSSFARRATWSCTQRWRRAPVL